MQRHSRRLTSDLTPLIDSIMILLFGVMINSVARREVDTREAINAAGEARSQKTVLEKQLASTTLDRDSAAAARDRLRQLVNELEGRLGQSEAQRKAADRRHLEEKLSLADAVAALLQMDDPQRLVFRGQLERLSGAAADRLREAIEQLRDKQDPVQVYKAVRRIEEMQKVFTFIDLHVDGADFLSVVGNTRLLERIPVREKSPAEIEANVRRILEAIQFNQMVLVLFSYEGEARDLTVERTESGVNSLLNQYRSTATNQSRQFRYGRVGLVSVPPPATRD